MINLYNMDCMIAMKEMKNKQFDLAICDPPYGIFGSNNKKSTFGWTKKSITKDGSGWGWGMGNKYKYGEKISKWDIPPDDNYFKELKRVSKEQIIFGANHYPYPYINFIIWDKINIPQSFSMSMAEIASVSIRGNGKIFKCISQNSDRFHPTQKPVRLYIWILENYAKEGDKILDTHLGSGSIAIACHNLSYDLKGYEIDKEYYDMAVKRLEKHKKQLSIYETNFFKEYDKYSI